MPGPAVVLEVEIVVVEAVIEQDDVELAGDTGNAPSVQIPKVDPLRFLSPTPRPRMKLEIEVARPVG